MFLQSWLKITGSYFQKQMVLGKVFSYCMAGNLAVNHRLYSMPEITFNP